MKPEVSRVDDADISNAITPVSSAAATDAPDSKSYCAPGRSVSTCCPGAPNAPAGSGCSLAAAASTPGTAAGKPSPAPPVAPTNVMPRAMPLSMRAVSSGSEGPARLRLTSGAPEARAAASARASVKVLQAAASLSGASCQQASNTSSSACGAMPTMPMWLLATAAIRPAIAVPWRRSGAAGSPARGVPSLPKKEWVPRIRPARSGCRASTPVSMSAMRTPAPWARA